MTEKTPQGSTKATSSVRDIMPEVKKILPIAIALVAPVLIFGYLIASRAPSTQGGANPGLADSQAVLMYSQPVPVRLDPHASADVLYRLPMPKDEKTGKEKEYGFLTLKDLGGVRIGMDGSVWIVVVFREEVVFQEYYAGNEEIKDEMYAPATYFKTVPGANGLPLLRHLDLG